jgi:hypothetical protein
VPSFCGYAQSQARFPTTGGACQGQQPRSCQQSLDVCDFSLAPYEAGKFGWDI